MFRRYLHSRRFALLIACPCPLPPGILPHFDFFLKFIDQISIMDVRRFWDYYALLSEKSPRALESFTQSFLSDFRKFGETEKDSMMLTAYRSLGPLFPEGRDMIQYMLNSLRMTGNVGGKDL